MSFNPLVEQQLIAERKLSELDVDLQKIRRDIEWFEKENLENLMNKIQRLELDLKERSAICDRIQAELLPIEQNFQNISQSINTLWNPRNWFDAQQIEYRAEAKKSKELLEKTKERLTLAHSRLAENKSMHHVTSVEIDKYTNFDLVATKNKRSNLEKQFALQKKQFDIISSRKKQIDEALEPIVIQLRQVDIKISQAIASKQLAQNFDKQLSIAPNSYERKIVHQACENMFGTGSPKSVIFKLEGEARQLQRDKEKFYIRAKSVAAKAGRNIKKLIFDGNNFCYQGDRFVGLSVIMALMPVLCNRYAVTVVFDATIRRKIQMSDKEIRDLLPSNIEIHVVATGVKADETILDLAGNDETAFVISNDRFAEFRDKQTVKDARLIRHEIVDGVVMINDLDISEGFDLA